MNSVGDKSFTGILDIVDVISFDFSFEREHFIAICEQDDLYSYSS